MAQKWVFAALMEISAAFPFPIRGIDSDNGSEFINAHLLRYCDTSKITFTRSRPGNKNDGAHIEQKNWSVVRKAVGYTRYDTVSELALLNEIYAWSGCRSTSSPRSRNSTPRPAASGEATAQRSRAS